MGRVVGLGQMLEIQPGIDLGRADIGVTEQLLHAAQVAAGLQHVAGKGMAQHVRMYRRAGVCHLAASLQALPYRGRTQARAIAPGKQCRLRRAGQSGLRLAWRAAA